MKKRDIQKAVKERYGRIAEGGGICCGNISSCCTNQPAEYISRGIGYTQGDMECVPEGANLGLGCGNPLALANLKEGETVLDLGSGAGFDSFLAAHMVGKKGRVIGVDMTPEMVEKARDNARKGPYTNVAFMLGEIENLPLPGSSVDVVISNCVINLSPHKEKVFKEAFRVLKSGGRLMVSDIVLLKPLPRKIKKSIDAYTGCIAGASLKKDYIRYIKDAGFEDVTVMDETVFPLDYIQADPTKTILDTTVRGQEQLQEVAGSVVSIKVFGRKTR